MNKKIISYSLIFIGIIVFSIASTYFYRYFLMGNSGRAIEGRISAGSMSNDIEMITDEIIEIYKNDSTIGDLVFSDLNSKKDESFYFDIQKKLGIQDSIDNRIGIYSNNATSPIYNTGTGCFIMRVTKESTYGIKWACELNSGSARFVIKDINGKVIYTIDENKENTQEEISLQPGDYFIYDQVDNAQDLQFYYYFAMK